MSKQRCLAVMIFLFAVGCCVDGPQAQGKFQKKDLEKPEYWTSDKGNRIHEELPYLKDPNPETRVLPPLKSKIRNHVYIVGDDHRGDLIRLERVKDYVLVNIRTFVDPKYRGRIRVGGSRLSHKGVTLFFGEKKAYGDYYLYNEIRAYADPAHDIYPMVVIRFYGPDKGVVYLDPLGSGEPQAIVNFSSAPVKE